MMKGSLLLEMKKNNIIDQLSKLNITNVEDKSYSELKYMLTMAKIKNDEDVRIESSENEWF